MTAVLDACAIIAYLRDEDGAEIVENILLQDDCMIHAINICEVYKDCLIRDGHKIANEMISELLNIGLVSREDMDEKLWKVAGQIKADIRRISIADCFAIALTKRLNGELYTSDHHEFDPIQQIGICKINFIR